MFNSGKINTLEGLDKDVGDVIEQTRNISHSLHPSAVAKLGMERSIVSLLEKTQASTGIISSISIKNNIETLPTEVKTQVFRIIQECINNTIRHANASALKVFMKMNSSSFTMVFRDNGIGIQQKEMINGIGMLTMLERAKSINGKINVPNSEKGFKLVLEIQLEE
jgi:signal transduction histidine kinase